MLDFMKNMATMFSYRNTGFSAMGDILICTLAEAYMTCYLRLSVVTPKKKVADEFPNMLIS